jgi:hypothetical protein
MMRYFNRTKGSVAVSFKSGASIAAPSKGWFEVPPEEDGSASILEHVAKGHIVRQMIFEEPLSAAPVPPVSVAIDLFEVIPAVPVETKFEISANLEEAPSGRERSKKR